MATTTTNLGLTKPAGTDKPDITVINENMDKIDAAVAGIEIGGRNLFRQSGHWTTEPTWWVDNGGGIELDTSVQYMGYNTIKTIVGGGIVGNYNRYFELDTNKIYTYSAMIKLTGDDFPGADSMPLHYHCSSTGTDYGQSGGVDIINRKQNLVNGEWNLLYLTFKPRGKYFRPFVFLGGGSTRVFNIAYLKLEEGNKPTDWTPAPEDVDNSIKAVGKEITVNLFKPTLETTTKNGVTCTNNGDGTYTLSGKNNGAYQSYFKLTDSFVLNNDCILTGCVGGDPNSFGLCVFDGNVTHEETDGSIPLSAGTYPESYIYVRSGILIPDNTIIKPMITTNLQATIDDFVPYTGDSGRLNGDVAGIQENMATIELGTDITD